MLRNGFNFGGEQSGHMIFRDYSTTGDGLVAALQILRIMKAKELPLSKLAKCWTRFPQLVTNILVREKRPFEELDGVGQLVAEAETELKAAGRPRACCATPAPNPKRACCSKAATSRRWKSGRTGSLKPSNSRSAGRLALASSREPPGTNSRLALYCCSAWRLSGCPHSMKSQDIANLAALPILGINSRPHNDALGGRFGARASQRIRLLLADDHPVVRRGIIFCLERHPNLDVVGEAADGEEALRKARELVPDILLTDVDMPGMTGLAVTEALRKELPQIKVLMLSGYSNTEFVLRCAQAGANGYILKQASPDEFVRAIEVVHAGQPYFSTRRRSRGLEPIGPGQRAGA